MFFLSLTLVIKNAVGKPANNFFLNIILVIKNLLLFFGNPFSECDKETRSKTILSPRQCLQFRFVYLCQRRLTPPTPPSPAGLILIVTHMSNPWQQQPQEQRRPGPETTDELEATAWSRRRAYFWVYWKAKTTRMLPKVLPGYVGQAKHNCCCFPCSKWSGILQN